MFSSLSLCVPLCWETAGTQCGAKTPYLLDMSRRAPALPAPPPRPHPTPRQTFSRAARRDVRRAAALAKELNFYSFHIHLDGSTTWTLHHPRECSSMAMGTNNSRAPREESKRAHRSRTRAAAHAELTERARLFRVCSVIRWWSRAAKRSPPASTLPPPPPSQPMQQQPPPQPSPPPPLLLPLLPPGERMDVDMHSRKRAPPPPTAVPAEPCAKRALLPLPPPGLPPPSLPPSPPISSPPSQPSSSPPPSRPAQRDSQTGVRVSQRNPAKGLRTHSEPHDPETLKSRRTQAHTPAATNRARAVHEAMLHAARDEGEEQCSLCTRYFPWLHNLSDARCHTCDVMDKHVRRVVLEQLQGSPSSESEPEPDPMGYQCKGCDALIHSSDLCAACQGPDSYQVWPGARVRLHSLTSAYQFNGRFGTVLDFVSDRVAVLVDDEDGGKRILVKRVNLARLSRRRDPDFDSDYDSDDACLFRKPWDSD